LVVDSAESLTRLGLRAQGYRVSGYGIEGDAESQSLHHGLVTQVAWPSVSEIRATRSVSATGIRCAASVARVRGCRCPKRFRTPAEMTASDG